MGHIGKLSPSSWSDLPIPIPDHSTVLTFQPKRFSQFPHVTHLPRVAWESSFSMCLLTHLARPISHWPFQVQSSFSRSPWRAQSQLLSCQGLRQGQQSDWMICSLEWQLPWLTLFQRIYSIFLYGQSMSTQRHILIMSNKIDYTKWCYLWGHIGKQIPSGLSVLSIPIQDHSTVLTSRPKHFSQFPQRLHLPRVDGGSSFSKCLQIHPARPKPHRSFQAQSNFSSSP